MTTWTAVVAAVPLAWLLPNHYRPWPTAWQDGFVLALVVIAALGHRSASRVAWPLALFVGVALVSIACQAMLGTIYFAGDAVVAVLYLAGFFVAVALGNGLAVGDRAEGLTALCAGTVVAAVLSVGVALLQWTGGSALGIWTVDMPPGGRPYANVAQPNHFCTICLFAIAAAGVLWQQQRIGRVAFWTIASWMVLGMVMSGSRTGWLQMLLLTTIAMTLGPRQGLALGRRGALLLGLLYAAGVTGWPLLNAALRLEEGRPLVESMQAGTRTLHWAAMIDAIGRQPWWGYGWQQVGVAQVLGAEAHPFVGESIEHSHNLVLDLLIWCGIPVGAALVAMAGWWYFSRLLRCRNATAAWLMIAVTGLSAHGMVEYPLTYAYFLVPLGVFMGAVDRIEQRSEGLRIHRSMLLGGALAVGVLLVGVGRDYLAAEQAHRLLRLESARIGVAGLTTPPPDLRWLTQQDAFLKFAQTQARVGMSPEELDSMRRVSERFAYPPSMYRYALAAGLNGQPDRARLTLVRLCRMHPIERCEEAREAWRAARAQHAELPAFEPPAPP